MLSNRFLDRQGPLLPQLGQQIVPNGPRWPDSCTPWSFPFASKSSGNRAYITTEHSNPRHHQEKWKALVIGINYFGQRGELKTCINEANSMANSLYCSGYPKEDTVLLTDDQKRPSSQPSKRNILTAIHWLVKDARPGDHLLFYYCGHGKQGTNFHTVEDNTDNESLYPCDFRDQGVIEEYEIHHLLSKALPPGVRLSVIIDTRFFFCP